MKTGERWASTQCEGMTVEVSADGELAFVTDPDGDVCSVPRSAWTGVADALLAAHVKCGPR